jgi:hypothetical protein
MSATTRIITGCDPPPDDKTLLLPRDADTDPLKGKKHLLLTAPGDKTKLLKWSRRADDGQGSCVSPSTLASLGGDATEVTYTGVGLAGRIRHDGMLRLQVAISILTVVAALLSAYGTYIKSTTAQSATTWDRHTATLVLAVAAALAVAKLLKEIREW